MTVRAICAAVDNIDGVGTYIADYALAVITAHIYKSPIPKSY